jgi:acyl-CoA synthetase (NDP forming)
MMDGFLLFCIRNREGRSVVGRIEAMESFFSPRSVAFVGASNNKQKWGGIVFRNLRVGGYAGRIYPVNPKEDEVQGHKAYPTVSAIPGDVDLAIFTIPARLMVDSISDCVSKGVKAGLVISAGFAELGDEGRALQAQRGHTAGSGGMVLIGPNGQGIAVPRTKLYPWMPAFKPDPGSIGIASQSGSVSTVLSQRLAEFGFGCSKVVSAGNCSDIGWPDYLEYFRQDPDTKVILLHMEGLQDGRSFFQAAKRTTLEKPVVIVKAGRTQVGMSAASTHTGALAGSDRVFSAACKQSGIIRMDKMEEAVIMAAALVSTPLPAGRRVAIITGGGGFGVIAADVAEQAGLDVVRLSEETIAKLRERLPSWWAPNNPVDLVAGLGYADAVDLIPILMQSGEVDGVMSLGMGWIYSMLDPVNSQKEVRNADNKIIRMLVDRDVEHGKRMADYSRKWDKPLLVTSNMARLAVRRGYSGLLEIIGRKFVVYPTIEEAVRAYAAMADRHDFLQNTKSAGRTVEA